MASQISRITNDLKTAFTPAALVASAFTLYQGWVNAGMTFTPATSATVYAILNRHFDIGQNSFDVALAAAEIDRNQLGQRIMTDQQGN